MAEAFKWCHIQKIEISENQSMFGRGGAGHAAHVLNPGVYHAINRKNIRLYVRWIIKPETDELSGHCSLDFFGKPMENVGWIA